MLILTVVKGPDQGRVYRLADGQSHDIGRDHGDVPLKDTKVSRRHARIVWEDGQWRVKDLGSTNGTLLNARRVESEAVPLQDGDLLHTGYSQMACAVVSNGSADDSDLIKVDDTSAGSASVSLLDESDSGPAVTSAAQVAPRSQRDERSDHDRGEPSTRQVLQQILAAVQTRDDQQLHAKLDRLLESVQAAAGDRDDQDSSRSESGLIAAVRQELSSTAKQQQQQLDQLKKAIESQPKPPDEATSHQRLIELLKNRLDESIQEKLQPLLEAVADKRPDDAVAARLDQLLESVQMADTTSVQKQLDELLSLIRQQNEAADTYTVNGIDQIIESLESLPQKLDQREQLERILNAVQSRSDEPPVASAVEPIIRKLDALMQQITAEPDVDLGARLDQLEQAIAALPAPPKPVDHQPQLQRITELLESVAARDHDPKLAAEIDALAVAVQQLQQRPEPPSLEPLAEQLRQVRQQIEQSADTSERDAATVAKLDELIALVSRLPAQLAPPSIEPLREAIDTLPQKLDAQSTLQHIIELLESNTAAPLEKKLDAALEALAAQPTDQIAAQSQQLQKIHEAMDALPQKLDTSAALNRIISIVEAAPNAKVEQKLDDLMRAVGENRNVDLTAPIEQLRQSIEALPQQIDQRQAIQQLRDSVAQLSDNKELEEIRQSIDRLASAEKPADLTPLLQRIVAAVEAEPKPDEQLADHLQQILAEVRDQSAQQRTQEKLDEVLAAVNVQDDTPARIEGRIGEVIESLHALADGQSSAALEEKIEQLAERLAAGAESTAALEHKLDSVLEALVQQRDASDDRELSRMLELVGAEAAGSVAADTQKTLAPVLQRLDTLETLLRKAPKQPAGAKAVAAGVDEQMVSDIFNVLRTIEQQVDRQAAKLRKLTEYIESAAEAPAVLAPQLTADMAASRYDVRTGETIDIPVGDYRGRGGLWIALGGLVVAILLLGLVLSMKG